MWCFLCIIIYMMYSIVYVGVELVPTDNEISVSNFALIFIMLVIIAPILFPFLFIINGNSKHFEKIK